MKLSNQIRLTVIATACALIGLADPAHATGNHTPTPPKESTAAGGHALSGSVSGAQSGSNSSSGASVGAVTAAGGQGGAGGSASSGPSTSNASSGDSTSGSSLSDQSTSNFWSQSRALGLTFAPGAFTPPMAPVQCASATITQSARGLGMGILSSADSKTDSSDCTLIQLRNAMVAACKFESAKQVEDLLVKKHLPDFKPSEVTYLKDKSDPGMVDYSPQQCAILTAPPPKPTEPVQLNWIYVPPPVARVEEAAPPPAAAVPPAKPRKPAPVKSISTKPPAKPAAPGTTLNCGDDGVPQCVAKPRKPLALSGGQEGRS